MIAERRNTDVRHRITGLLERLSTPLVPEAYLATFAPLLGSELRGVVESITALTESSAAVRIRTGSTWTPHRAGQFVTVGVDVEGIRHHRCYSITSADTGSDGWIEIGVQAVPGGTVSEHLVHRARPGEVVQLAQPDGSFTIPADLDTPLLMITAGSGITPVMGMLRSLDAAGVADAATIRVLHFSPTADRTMFAAELDRLAADRSIDLDVVHTRAAVTGTRHLTAELLDEFCPDWRQRRTYVCGPEQLVSFAVEHWHDAGIDDRLAVERFVAPSHPTGAARSNSDQPSTALFAGSDVVAAAGADTPLLEVAEQAGLTPAFGCRMGICRTCSTRLESGCVVDLRDGRTHEAGGHVQICVSAAAGDVVLDL